MKKPQKFLFDTKDFDRSEKPEEKAPVFSEAQFLIARTEGHAQGKAERVRETRQQQEEKIAQALEKTLGHIEKLLANEQDRNLRMQAQSLELVRQIIQKLMPALAHEHTLGEVFRTVSASLDERKEEPRIVIAVHDSLFSALKERVDGLSAERGYTGRLIVLADETLSPADCRVEWADGGAERNFEKIYSAIDVEIKKAIETLSTSNGE